MKKRVISIVLPIIMLLSATGILVSAVASCGFLGEKFSGFGYKPMLNFIIVAVLWFVFFISLVLYLIFKRKGIVSNMVTQDALTGLATDTKISAFFDKVKNKTGYSPCVVYIGYDANAVLARYGIDRSRSMQRQYAEIISKACGGDTCSARLCDGTFLLVLNCKNAAFAQKGVDELLGRLNHCRMRALIQNAGTIKAGIYVCEGERISFEKAVENAKTAYRFALDSKAPSYICTEELHIKDAAQERLRKKLCEAIDDDQFEIFLQFVHGVKENGYVGAEVLSRWNNPEEGLLLPGHYINDMRSTGVIEKFDMYMLGKTCALLAEWSDGDLGQLLVSCNITRVTISSADFLKEFNGILEKYDFDRNRLMIEITEDAFIVDKEMALMNIEGCKKKNIRVAIDDFGAGSTSANEIEIYPVGHLKIDRRTVTAAIEKRNDKLLKSIIDVAHSRGIKVTCEGVETKKQSEAVAQCGTDYIQGYYYSYVFAKDEGKEHFLKSIKAK